MFRNFCIYVNPWSEDAELPKTHSHTNLTFLGQEKLLRRTQIQLILDNIKIAINIDQAMLKSLVYISENKYKKLGREKKYFFAEDNNSLK